MKIKYYYYCINYFYSRKDSGSYFLKTEKHLDTEEEVFEEAISTGLIPVWEFDNLVNYEEITDEDYFHATGKK